MKIFLLILFAIAITLCKAQQVPTRVVCSKDLTSYTTLKYEIDSKQVVIDSVYSANVFITILRPSKAFYLGDTLYMYSLAIANHENLVKARFFTHYEPYIMANTLDLKEFELYKMREELNEENWNIIIESLFGNLIIDKPDFNWRKQLHSGNIELGGMKQIPPINGEFARKIYFLDQE
ncbi:MAG: hypothetical protein IPL92_08160 [Saprospiraceae bacterium]|nr:hypothetical protein [Candidatus Opimibacter iunctus]